MQTDPHCFLNRAILASDPAYRALERQEQTALQAGDQAQAQALGAQLRERELKAFHAQRAKERACAGALGHMAAIGGVGYLTGGTGLPTYLLSMSAMSATSMALDPRLRRQWAAGDWPEALAASQAHLPLWSTLHSSFDAWERGAYVQAGVQAGAFALDVAGLKGAWQGPRSRVRVTPQKAVKGEWVVTNEYIKPKAASYQTHVTGKSAKQSYRLNSVKYDDMRNGVLIDAKSNYEQFITSDGVFKDWFKESGLEKLMDQGRRQVKAAEGVPIEWHFEHESVLKAFEKAIVKSKSLQNLKLIHTPRS